MKRLESLKFYNLICEAGELRGHDGFKAVVSHSLLVLGFLAVFFVLLKVPTDPDFGWHLQLGEFVVDQRQIPRQNLFSYTLPEHLWADSYWLTQILMVGLERTAGLLGLSLFFALIASLAVAIATGFHPFVSFLVAILFIPAAGVRPLVLSTLLFSFLWFVLQKVWRDVESRWLFFLPPLFLLWANVHADFVIGLFVLGVALSLESIRRRKFLAPAVAGLASVAVTLINPYGLFLWETLAKEAGSQLMRNTIAEWLPANTHTEFGLFFLSFLFLLNFLFFLNKKKLRLSETVLLTLFSLLSLFSIYYIRLLAIMSGPFLVRGFRRLSQASFFTDSSRRFIKLYASACLAAFALGVGPLALVPKFLVESSSEEALAEAGGYPYEAVEFLRANPQAGNIFNDYVWGGYLIWQLPEVKTFIDGRMPAWREGDKYVFEDYLAVMRLKPGWEEVLEKYQISYFLIKSDSALAQALKVHPGWRIVYEDELAAVFGK